MKTKRPVKSKGIKRVLSKSESETLALGESIGSSLPKGTVVILYGELGAGKTTLMKGLIHAATAEALNSVTSPTFNLLQIYEGEKPVYHFDLYRLKSQGEFLAQGFQDYFNLDGICCIEWPEMITQLLPEKNILTIQILHEGKNQRAITLDQSRL